MKTELLRNLPGYAEFKTLCSFEKCEDEYPGWTGKEKYIVFSELCRKDLEARFPEITARLSPYILIDASVSKALVDYKNNEKKHQWRASAHHSSFSFDADTEIHHPSLVNECFESELLLKLLLHDALKKLSETQQRRVILRYFEGLSYKQIAKQEGVSLPVAFKSVGEAIKNLKNFIDEG